MKILPSFTHPQVVVNLYGFLSSAENKGRCSRTIGIKKLFGTIDFIVEKNKYFGSQWCQSLERNPYRFATT